MKEMKKKVITAILTVVLMISLTGCTEKTMAKNFGGDMTIDLPANQKLEMITWKDDDSLWYLTKPMTEENVAETHTFQQDSSWGIFEGTVTIVESKTE
jgi:uncharacterized lipoprotein YehR (DUF1307 family)